MNYVAQDLSRFQRVYMAMATAATVIAVTATDSTVNQTERAPSLSRAIAMATRKMKS